MFKRCGPALLLKRTALALAERVLANGTRMNGTFDAQTGHLVKGSVFLPDERVFTGEFDSATGAPLPGTFLNDNGDEYKGAFNKEWQRHGEGEAWLLDGTKYSGTFDHDDFVRGIVRIPNGATESIFEGELADESFVRGVLKQHDFTYTGEFKNNAPEGKGKLVFTTGAEQEGTFFQGKLHGTDCKMKLDGGFFYVGEFMDGVIRRGNLYTPTYTYEGEFNSNGRAHGEGVQIQLANSPRLYFTGIWSDGVLVRGTCVDEEGNPVDWQDNHSLQQRVLSNDGTTSQESAEGVDFNNYCAAKVKEADKMHREMNSAYVEDAETVRKTTGRFPSKMDLGYEGSIQRENEMLQQASKLHVHEVSNTREALKERAQEFQAVCGERDTQETTSNMGMAQMHFSRQVGAQQLAAERVDEQLERFMSSQRSKQSDAATSNSTNSSQKLNIDSNATWKAYTPN